MRPIAFFLPSVRAGGAQRVVVNLVQGIAERGLPVDVVLVNKDGAFLQELPASVRIVDLHAGRLLRSLAPLARYLRKERPRVLVSSMSHANLIALWASKLAGGRLPVVVTEHSTMSQAGTTPGQLDRGFLPALLRTFYPWAASVVAVSKGAADDLARTSGLPRERVQVVYNPVITPALMAHSQEPPDHPWFEPGQPPVVLGVGRLTPAKDFPTLLRAFAEVRRRRPARLMILGEGAERPKLEAIVRELGIGEDVALPGFRENAAAYMAASSVFVLSSAWEGLPTVLIEALAAGARVVSTDCPSGPREILQGGRLGRLVPVGDVNALADGIQAVLDCPRIELPSGALTPFTRDAAVDNYLRLIEGVGSARQRVLLLSTSLGLGGADRQILYLARALLAHGYDVRLVSMTPLVEMGRLAVAEGLPITSLEMRRGKADLGALRKLVAMLREWRPHILTSFMYHANIMGRVAGRRAGVPLIVSSIRSEQNGSTARDWGMRLTNWMDHCCTTNSRRVADALSRRRLVPSRKLRVIPNGVDVAAFSAGADEGERIRRELGLAPGEFLWLAVGRLFPEKDYPTLLRAFQSFAGTPARLAVAGRGDLLEELRGLAEQLGVASQVIFLGVRHDIAALLAAADGLVLASASEGMPNVVMEALAAGRPVVATDVGGVSELVEAGVSGFVVPPRDPAALSERMRHLMSLPPEQRRRMGQKGRERMLADYSLQAMADRWIDLYRELLISVERAG